MSIQSLPVEIVRVVVEHLAPSNNDLSSISRVSSYFLPLARPLLFSSIRLPKFLPGLYRNPVIHRPVDRFGHRISAGRDYQQFIAFLAASPDLALLIHDLTLWEGASDPHGSARFVLRPLSLNVVHAMIAKLPALRSLWLHMVQFERTSAPVPPRYANIDRLVISGAVEAHDVAKPLALFTHVQELSMSFLFDIPTAPPFATFAQLLGRYDLSSSVMDALHVSKIHFHSRGCVLDNWMELFRQTPTPTVLRSFSIHCDRFTTDGAPSSTMFDLLHDAAATLTHITLGASHSKRHSDTQTPYFEDAFPERCAYRQFDSGAMRDRLAPLTALRSLTLKFQFHDPDRNLNAPDSVLPPHEAFTRMVPILAAFPPCLERIAFSFAEPQSLFVETYSPPYWALSGGSWLWPELNLPVLAPWLRRYKRLRAIVFEGAEGVTSEERARILSDLPEFHRQIQFVE